MDLIKEISNSQDHWGDWRNRFEAKFPETYPTSGHKAAAWGDSCHCCFMSKRLSELFCNHSCCPRWWMPSLHWELSFATQSWRLMLPPIPRKLEAPPGSWTKFSSQCVSCRWHLGRCKGAWESESWFLHWVWGLCSDSPALLSSIHIYSAGICLPNSRHELATSNSGRIHGLQNESAMDSHPCPVCYTLSDWKQALFPLFLSHLSFFICKIHIIPCTFDVRDKNLNRHIYIYITLSIVLCNGVSHSIYDGSHCNY